MFAARAFRLNRGYVCSCSLNDLTAWELTDFLLQTEIDQKTIALGGIHKYDLTPDVTHLLVGDYDTPKYRHVARERQDIKAMDAAWIEAMTDLWKNDEEIDFLQLESEYQLKALQRCSLDPADSTNDTTSLLICLTGFGDQRDAISKKIVDNGGRHTGDLTRKCSHLIVSKPEGKKFTAAKSWGVRTVTLAWLDQSIERGLILDEEKFDPLLPADEQGVDAWIKKDTRHASLGKRSRSARGDGQPDGGRKLRKTASMKLSSQTTNLWGDILDRSTFREYSFAGDGQGQDGEAQQQTNKPTQIQVQADDGIFANCVFSLHGFSKKQSEVLNETIASLDGQVVASLDAAEQAGNDGNELGRFLIVPQTSQPETHPSVVPDDFHVVTEFYVEKCLHSKQFIHPSDHVLGRPFPLFPVKGFSDLTVCTAAFTGLELYHVAKAIKQLGASLEEQFRPSASLLICKSLDSLRRDKLKYAMEWKVPVVSADWLWECISAGFKVPFEDFIYPELKKRYTWKTPRSGKPSDSEKNCRTDSSKDSRGSRSGRLPLSAGMDPSAFDLVPKAPGHKQTRGSTATSGDAFISTTTSRETPDGASEAPPLGELSPASINKSPSPSKSVQSNTLRKASDESRASDKLHKSATSGLTDKDSPVPRGAVAAAAALEDDESRQSARQAARQAEREQLTSRLTSLLDATATGPASDGEPSTVAGAAPRARKRQILGRAMSNASNASSAATGPVGATGSETLKRTMSALGGTQGSQDQSQEDQQPPPTQVEYHDPQAQERRKLLMSKMMGQTTDEAATAATGERSLRTRSA